MLWKLVFDDILAAVVELNSLLPTPYWQGRLQSRRSFQDQDILAIIWQNEQKCQANNNVSDQVSRW